MRIDEFEEVDDSEQPVDPFVVTGLGHVAGRILWLYEAVSFWLIWPFFALGRLLGDVFGFVAWRLGYIGHVVWDTCMRAWWALLDFLGVEGVRQKVSSLQTTATRSVEDVALIVGAKTVDSQVTHRFADALFNTRARLALGWYGMLDRASRSPVLRLLTAPLRWATRIFVDVSDFTISWVLTREYRHLLFGIPAFLLMMPLAYCAVRLPFHTSEVKAKHYRRAANEAIAAEDAIAAELYFRKLTQLGHVHDHVAMRAALFDAKNDDIDSAYEKMLKIASPDEPGLRPAHLWIAQAITNGQIERDNPQQTELIESHLQNALEGQLDDAPVQLWLAGLYQTTGRTDEAREQLQQISERHLEWTSRARLAELMAQTGQYDDCRQLARSIVSHYRLQSERGEPLSELDYLSWGAGAELMGDQASAVSVMLEGLDKFPSSDLIRETAPLVCVDYFDQMGTISRADWDRKIELLERMVRDCGEIEPALIRAARLVNSQLVGDRAQALLDNCIDPLPSATLKVLGDMAIMRERFDDARRLYAEAVERDPDNHVASNNLAYLLAHNEPVDLQQAVKLADRAVQLQPDNPHYRETRGQISVLMGRWDEAVEDLSLALNGMTRKQREIHQSLGIALKELGQAERAKFHKARAER